MGNLFTERLQCFCVNAIYNNKALYEELCADIPPTWWKRLVNSIFPLVAKNRVAIQGLTDLDGMYVKETNGYRVPEYRNVNLHRIILQCFSYSRECPDMFIVMFAKEADNQAIIDNAFAVYSLFFLKGLPFTLLDITSNLKCTTSFITAINKMGGMLPPHNPPAKRRWGGGCFECRRMCC
jgi:hypothetical protein